MWIYDSPILLHFHKIIEDHPLVVEERNLDNILLNQINSTCPSFSSSDYIRNSEFIFHINLFYLEYLISKNKSWII